MKAIERLVMHAGKFSGMSLEEVNALLVESALEPVKATNWRFVDRYVPWTTREPAALATLSLGAGRKAPPKGGSEGGKAARKPRARRASANSDLPTAEPNAVPRLRLIKGGLG